MSVPISARICHAAVTSTPGMQVELFDLGLQGRNQLANTRIELFELLLDQIDESSRRLGSKSRDDR